MVIEFAGLPGSGKSTLVRRVTRDLGLPTCVLAPLDSWGLLRHPRSALTVVLGLPALSWARGQRSASLRLLQLCAAQGALSQSRTPWLLEEGLVHHVWRAVFLQPELANTAWPRMLTGRHSVLVLETDDQTRYSRIQSKTGRGPVNEALRRAGIGGPEWTRSVESFREVLGAVARSGWTVCRVDTSGSIDEAFDRIRSEVQSRIAVPFAAPLSGGHSSTWA